jgi:CheY-like chemotaxis protein
MHVCGEAKDGKKAVEKVKTLNPDLVLLDINMPVMNGIQAAFEIRRISPGTKILFLTVVAAMKRPRAPGCSQMDTLRNLMPEKNSSPHWSAFSQLTPKQRAKYNLMLLQSRTCRPADDHEGS